MEMIAAATSQLERKVRELLTNPINLQARRGPDDRLEIPVTATCMFALTFTLLDLREMGVDVRIHTPDGRVMTDDEVAAAILHSEANSRAEP